MELLLKPMEFFHLGLFITFLVFTDKVSAAIIDTLDIPSVAMNLKLGAGLVVPQFYKKAKASYPVLYLLHGFSVNFCNWLTKTPDKQLLHKLADHYNIIIVTPDGGYAGWYLNSPIDK